MTWKPSCQRGISPVYFPEGMGFHKSLSLCGFPWPPDKVHSVNRLARFPSGGLFQGFSPPGGTAFEVFFLPVAQAQKGVFCALSADPVNYDFFGVNDNVYELGLWSFEKTD